MGKIKCTIEDVLDDPECKTNYERTGIPKENGEI